MTKYDSGLIMEAVDPVIKHTPTDLAAINKALQLALLCTKKQPAARPTMHDVVRVLLSLFPAAPKKPMVATQSGVAYPRYLDEYGDSKSKDDLNLTGSSSTSAGHLFVKFGEVISQNTV